MTSEQWDAAALRVAAGVLHRRARKQTFALQVIIRLLQRTADRIDPGGCHPEEVTGRCDQPSSGDT